MYKNLIEIGLHEYLNNYFFNEEWILEEYLNNLDTFVGSKGKAERELLKSKFNKPTGHLSINDHFHEIMVAHAFHPNGIFQDEGIPGGSPDIIDAGIPIEVKTINAPPGEVERIKIIKPGASSVGPFPNDDDFKNRFEKKFSFRVEKAKKQISNEGIIYIVWDSTIKGFHSRKNLIENLLSELIRKENLNHPEITINQIYFGDLREKVAARGTFD